MDVLSLYMRFALDLQQDFVKFDSIFVEITDDEKAGKSRNPSIKLSQPSWVVQQTLLPRTEPKVSKCMSEYVFTMDSTSDSR